MPSENPQQPGRDPRFDRANEQGQNLHTDTNGSHVHAPDQDAADLKADNDAGNPPENSDNPNQKH